MNLKITGIGLLIILGIFRVNAQQVDLYPYFPEEYKTDDWKIRVDVFGSERSGSNSFTSKFFDEVTGSGYLSPEMKDEQISKFNGDIYTGTIRSVGGGVYINSKKVFYYAGIEHQHVLDTRIDDELVKLLLLGNKPFAGSTIDIGSSDYNSIYFNRIMGGVGYELDKEGLKHTFFGKIGLTSGQNYENIKLDQASFYTHPDGDFLDVAVKAETQIADTVWADVFDINGLGASLDLSYVLQKEKDYSISFTVKNIGFITWNGNPFSATVDTSFHFEGASGDTTTSSGEVPDDYSYKSLRELIFKNPDASSFTSTLPLALNLSGGKYFSGDQFYTGINVYLYPSLEANYHAELFGTWNYKHIFQITPILSYNSYKRVNFGLSAGVKIGENIFLRAGTAFLDSYFNRDSPVAAGGFLQATVVW